MGAGKPASGKLDHCARPVTESAHLPGFEGHIHINYLVIFIHVEHINRDRHKVRVNLLRRGDEQTIAGRQVPNTHQAFHACPEAVRNAAVFDDLRAAGQVSDV